MNIVLVEPEIPHNTGAIARTCALTNTKLHLVKPLGFSVSDKFLKRAGLDYWHLVDITYYEGIEEFLRINSNKRLFFCTTKANKLYTDIEYLENDFLVFGKETKGLPNDLIINNLDNAIKIPMISDIKRSLNLANAVNIILFEALRQKSFIGLI